MSAIRVIVRIPTPPSGAYPIVIQNGLLARLHALVPPRRYAVIADTRVAGLWGRRVIANLRAHGIDAGLVTFPGGERSKTREMKARIEDRMFQDLYDRSAGIIALGGGVTGDLAGFVAATYMRGIPFVQVPTTLLAHIDSSIGGKTAVNTPLGKNLVGAFAQPEAVLIDTATLRTLPRRAVLDGMAEIIKHAVIRSRTMFIELERNMDAIVDTRSGYPMGRLIAQNCRIKAAVVMADEKEGDVRRVLNFGHTIGHAVETFSKGRLSHGEAVAIGMAVECRIAAMLGLWRPGDAARAIALIQQAGLPFRLPPRFPGPAILAQTRHDKKSIGGTVTYALPDRIGNCRHGIKVDDRTVRAALATHPRG
ncbi:MAG: 3-dehydroquinate synthase [Planctomycetota bacterium]